MDDAAPNPMRDRLSRWELYDPSETEWTSESPSLEEQRYLYWQGEDRIAEKADR